MSIPEDIARSSEQFTSKVAPLFAGTFLDGTWRRLEGEGGLASVFDMQQGCDWMLTLGDGRLVLVSTRNQFAGNHKNWTIRYSLRSGRETEFAKLTKTDGTVQPGWFVQSHAFSDGEVIAAAAIQTSHLATMLQRGQFSPRGGMPVAGGNRMVCVEWKWASDYQPIQVDGPAITRVSGWGRRMQEQLF